MKRICHISTVHKPFDTRIFHKQCSSLAQLGHKVSLVVSHDKNETVNGVDIIALSTRKNRLYRIFIKSKIAFFKALKTKSNIYHIHDPELIFLGFWLKIFNKKVVMDMHELVYEQILDKGWLGKLWQRKMIASFYRFFERIAVRWFDAIVLAEDGYQEYFEKFYKKYQSKTILARNYPIFELIQAHPSTASGKDKLKLIYAGGLTKIRGIQEICDAVKDLKDVEVHLMGPWESDAYKETCLNGKDNIIDHGFLPLTQVYELMHGADVGIATLYPVKNYLTSQPVKGFEYMACGIPILMSDFPMWMEFYKECAYFVDPKSSDSIKAKIQYILVHPDEMKQKGLTGKKIGEEKYQWKTELNRLAETYEKIYPSKS